ncbi:MAG: sugar phosphate isomerase/epimerase family protein [Acidobacteriaceae bacterium]
MKTTRRWFVQASALAAGCVIVFPRRALGQDPGPLNYGVQLYMVRRQAATDLAGILRSIRQIGFTQIELYPVVYDHPAAELKKMVEDAGLGLVSAHFNYADFADRIDYARQLGLKYMVCPMVPQAQWNSTAGFEKAADDFNRWGAKLSQAGMQFAFHNHCYEFKPLDGGLTGWQVLMGNTDPILVMLELDIYWLVQAGQNPAAVMQEYKDRVKLIHLKDRTPGAPTGFVMGPSAEHFTELGKGSIDWPHLLMQARWQGIRYAYLDQDETAEPVVQSMRESFAYLKGLNI